MDEAGRPLTKEDKLFIAETVEKVFDPADLLYSDYKECLIAFGAEKGKNLATIDSKKLQWYVESRIKAEQKEAAKNQPMSTRSSPNKDETDTIDSQSRKRDLKAVEKEAQKVPAPHSYIPEPPGQQKTP